MATGKVAADLAYSSRATNLLTGPIPKAVFRSSEMSVSFVGAFPMWWIIGGIVGVLLPLSFALVFVSGARGHNRDRDHLLVGWGCLFFFIPSLIFLCFFGPWDHSVPDFPLASYVVAAFFVAEGLLLLLFIAILNFFAGVFDKDGYRTESSLNKAFLCTVLILLVIAGVGCFVWAGFSSESFTFRIAAIIVLAVVSLIAIVLPQKLKTIAKPRPSATQDTTDLLSQLLQSISLKRIALKYYREPDIYGDAYGLIYQLHRLSDLQFPQYWCDQDLRRLYVHHRSIFSPIISPDGMESSISEARLLSDHERGSSILALFDFLLKILYYNELRSLQAKYPLPDHKLQDLVFEIANPHQPVGTFPALEVAETRFAVFTPARKPKPPAPKPSPPPSAVEKYQQETDKLKAERDTALSALKDLPDELRQEPERAINRVFDKRIRELTKQLTGGEVQTFQDVQAQLQQVQKQRRQERKDELFRRQRDLLRSMEGQKQQISNEETKLAAVQQHPKPEERPAIQLRIESRLSHLRQELIQYEQELAEIQALLQKEDS